MSRQQEELTVSAADAGQRLDHFLAAKIPEVSRAYLQKQIENGKILLNHTASRKGTILRPGDLIQIVEILEPQERRPPGNPDLQIPIVFEDESLAVIDKPAGIPTHPVSHEENHTVANWWIARNPAILEDCEDPLRPGIVHRLDTGTSGLLILAKSQEIVNQLQTQFRNRQVKKIYHALVHGRTPEQGKIDLWIAHDPKNKRRMIAIRDSKDAVKWKAREAHTEFEVLERFADYTYLAVRTRTGRMHQVRVHLAALGHPLVGDPIYIGHLRDKDRPFGLARHFLHAAVLCFQHPVNLKALQFDSPLPPQLAGLLRNLRGAS